MVDAVNLLLGENGPDLLVDGFADARVMSQRLFQHDARQRRDHFCVGKIFADHGEEIRGGGEEEYPHDAVAVLEQGRQGSIVLRGAGIDLEIVQQAAETLPLLGIEFPAEKFTACGFRLQRVCAAR